MSRIPIAAIAVTSLCLTMLTAQEQVDLSIIHRIKAEASDRSQAMDHLFQLTDVLGPRLTNSPGFFAAARWAVERFKSMGIESARLEPWGRFGKGWSYSRLSVHLLEPAAAPLQGVPLAWCSGTQGPVAAEAVLAPIEWKDQEGDVTRIEEAVSAFEEKHRGNLRGKVVLLRKERDLALPLKPAASRLEESDLAGRAQASELSQGGPVELPILRIPEDPKERERIYRNAPAAEIIEYWQRLRRSKSRLYVFLAEEGVVAAVTTDDRGDGGSLFAEAAGRWEEDAPPACPAIVLIPEHYNRLARLAAKGIGVRMEIDLAVRFHDVTLDGVNVIAEIPGGSRRDEVVMLGAHLDSWHAGTGATDNAVGCAAVIEAARILKALDLRPARTVRFALWSGEEQGILGSRAYVKSHFGDPAGKGLTPEHARLSAYFNLDNGAGKIRGIHLQGNDMARPIFEAWLAPFRDLGASTVTLRSTGGTDHLGFDAAGLPAFQFLQDPLDYGSRAHHGSLDTSERCPPGDLLQASSILAAFAWQAASREALLPRKPLPKP